MSDSYDCNGPNTQDWQWYGDSLVSVSLTDLTHWCLDAGDVDESESRPVYHLRLQ